MRRYLNILFLLTAILVAACSVEEKTHADGESATYTCPMHPQIVQNEPGTCPICFMDLVPVSQTGKENGELMLSQSQIALGNIKTKRIKFGSVGSNAILTGKLVLDETQTDVVSSRAAGRIEKLYLKESGQPIKKGQPLYELYSEELLTLQREYLLALRQNQELGQENPRFTSFLEAAKKKLLLYGLTEAQIQRLASSGQVSPRITFVAPVSGVVTEVAAAEGQYVAEGGILYRLGRLDKIWVEAEVYPQELARVNEGDALKVAVEGFSQTPVSATVTFISPEFKAGSQVATLRAELPNPNQQYLPGMQASVILRNPNGKSLTLPTDAVLRDSKGSHVWVQSGKDTFKAQMVKLGAASADSVAILSGLKENDRVVVSGAYLLYSEFVLKQGADPMAGHQH
ncbi:efflux RND transporter periplasmic adaptor subunit [Pontibacter sp. FD36]|uniref:efflux RND transporter periplasmic adaptor subunit n=1 Tax=Pontibacter sp. FD36 TaxID=2789860 RepID=UPI0018AC700F|nr:efflux RND transporter periplasmic adaptor subunit [Pontibacter sp. FD36]MBF8961699.1 efflux RND transporter periplasmic adaptor subunit [Pontibacter sp. FD36]